MLLLAVQILSDDFPCLDAPFGYGALATGGAATTLAPQIVETEDELRDWLLKDGPAIIFLKGAVTMKTQVRGVIRDKTLIGLDGAELILGHQDQYGPQNGMITLDQGSRNVIFRNINFHGPGAYDTDGLDLITNRGCRNFWVDHCSFFDGVDGNFDNTGQSDNITVSFCKFGYKLPPRAGGPGGSNDHRFSDLVGASDDDPTGDLHLSITWYFNYWSDGVGQRMPRARNCELHILNCMWNTTNSGSIAVGIGGGDEGSEVLVENGLFLNVTNIYRSYDKAGSSVKAHVTFLNCDISAITRAPAEGWPQYGDPQPVAVTKYDYESYRRETSEVLEIITGPCGAGATLHVKFTGDGTSDYTIGCNA